MFVMVNLRSSCVILSSSKREQSVNRATLRSRATLRAQPISNEGARIPPQVTSQNPADAQWPRNGRVTMLEYEKVKIT